MGMKMAVQSAVLAALLLSVTTAWAQTGERREAPAPVIEPQVDRRTIKIPAIDSDDLEIGYYTGVLSVEDFGSETVSGWRLAYHLTEDLFLEGALGDSTVTDEQFRTLLPSGIFVEPVEELRYWVVSVGLHFLPGEVFVGKKYAFGSGVYMVAGIGNVEFADVSSTIFSAGLGVRMLPLDWVSLRVEMRDHIFDQDILGRNKQTHNFELTFGLSAYF